MRTAIEVASKGVAAVSDAVYSAAEAQEAAGEHGYRSSLERSRSRSALMYEITIISVHVVMCASMPHTCKDQLSRHMIPVLSGTSAATTADPAG